LAPAAQFVEEFFQRRPRCGQQGKGSEPGVFEKEEHEKGQCYGHRATPARVRRVPRNTNPTD